MSAAFHPRLVNGPFEDPALFISFAHRKQAVLFDLGELSALSSRDILKISHIFVSHTHIDHFVGFDRVLRLMLGRPKYLQLYGPKGFLDNVAGKLRAYSWNLLPKFAEGLTLEVTEIEGDRRTRRTFDFRSAFTPDAPRTEPLGGTALYCDPEICVDAEQLDHGIACLGLRLEERFHVNIQTSGLQALGLSVGPWVSHFKTMLYRQSDPDSLVEIPPQNQSQGLRRYALGRLAEQIAVITPGHKTVYVADVVYTPANEEKIVRLAAAADYLFIEAAFLESEHAVAREKFHLTAHQAGTIARKAGVRQMTIFHHSPRYLGREQLLVNEARAAFEATQ